MALLKTILILALSSEYVATYRSFEFTTEITPHTPYPNTMRANQPWTWPVTNKCCPAISSYPMEHVFIDTRFVRSYSGLFVNSLIKSSEKIDALRYLKKEILPHIRKPTPIPFYKPLSTTAPVIMQPRNVIKNQLFQNPYLPNLFRNNFVQIGSKEFSPNNFIGRKLNQLEETTQSYMVGLPNPESKNNPTLAFVGHSFYPSMTFNAATTPINKLPVTNVTKTCDELSTPLPHYNTRFGDRVFNKADSFIKDLSTQPATNLDKYSNKLNTVIPHYNTFDTRFTEIAINQSMTPRFGGDLDKVHKPAGKNKLITVTPSSTVRHSNAHKKNNNAPKKLSNSSIKVTTDRKKDNSKKENVETTTAMVTIDNAEKNKGNASQESAEDQRKKELFQNFTDALDRVDRKFFATTFNKLASISPPERRENGISFAQSGLFLGLLLLALSTEADAETAAEIDRFLHINFTDTEKIQVIKHTLSVLPPSSDGLKFRWATRLVLGAGQEVSEGFRRGAAAALKMYLGKVAGNETEEELATKLNHMVEEDSGGAIHDTFEPDELSSSIRAVAVSTVYLRGRWRAAPTVLNGTRPFRGAGDAPARAARMIRLNDVMRYASLDDCHFDALEISYSTEGLTLLLLVPHGSSLRPLTQQLPAASLDTITRRLATVRVAATMPLYTLRMTLLLPSKLEAMGLTKLTAAGNGTDDGLKLSHAVQRLMFWSEAGINAFKDDGIEWDDTPELELVIDRPYMFFVRWHNITLMSGDFLL